MGKELDCGLGREGIFTQTVARRSNYRHRDGKNSLIFRRGCSVNFVNMYFFKKEDMDEIITVSFINIYMTQKILIY